MIQIDELKITPSGDCFKLNCYVEGLDYYEDIYLKSIIIDTQDTFLTSGPSENYIYKKDFKAEDKIKKAELSLTKEELCTDLDNNIFFVYITVQGTPAPDTPCGYDNKITLASVVNLYPIFHNTVCLLKQMNRDCEIPKDLIQLILQVKALELSIKSGQHSLAIKHWNILKGNGSKTNNCGCK